MTSHLPAPTAPGRLGVAVDAGELRAYLDDLRRWLDARRDELDRLDEATRAASDAQPYTGDVILALTLWQAISTRAELLREAWDSGRADAVARERMSQLIWGRLDSGSGAELVSLVEAATLCDAVTAQLRSRLAFDPAATDQAVRLRDLRAAIVRCEDLAADQPDAAGAVGELRERLGRITTQASRGSDVTGPLAELEAATATTERDLIVAAARRRELASDRVQATQQLAALAAREPTLRALVDRCRREVTPCPNLAVPAVGRLGSVPEDAEALTQFRARLTAVQRAQDTVEQAYAAPLRERAELRYRLAQLEGQAKANGRETSATVRSGYDEADEALSTTPCPLPMARFLVDQYEYLAREAPRAHDAPQEGVSR